MSAPFESCTFEGTAVSVRVVGKGQAVLTAPAPFSDGKARRVELFDAQIGGRSVAVIEEPQQLTPVAQNDDGVSYDATYAVVGLRTLSLQIVGGNVGHYRGPGCDSPRGCSVVFGAGAKGIALQRADDAPMAITEEFPFGVREQASGGGEPASVSLVELQGANGTVDCRSGRETKVSKADLRFPSGVTKVSAIRFGEGKLTMTVEAKRPPVQLRSWAPLAIAAPVAAAVLLVSLYLVVRRWRRRRPQSAPGPGTDFDVFLCHNSKDKPEVKRIGEELRRRKLKVFLDEWDLPPGKFWRTALESQIQTVRSAAVFFGQHGIGDWQNVEITALLEQLVKKDRAVIPVFLPSAAPDLQLPPFLSGVTYVDFRVGAPAAMERLIWGITQRRATGTTSPVVTVETPPAASNDKPG
jgi:hypothetical protein